MTYKEAQKIIEKIALKETSGSSKQKALMTASYALYKLNEIEEEDKLIRNTHWEGF